MSNGKPSKAQMEKLLTGELDENSPLFQKLMLESSKDLNANDKPESFQVAPKPGFCLKTWKKDNTKVFVNVCTSDSILKPKDLSEKEVREIVESADPTRFRVPMGIGEAHKEKDKGGQEADTYDIVIHSSFYTKVQTIDFFKEFFLQLLFDGLESKYDLELTREYRILKNRKVMGTLQTQNVRNKSKPVIMEMDKYMYEMEKEAIDTQRSKAVITEVSTSSNYTEPTYKILQEPETGHPEFLVLEVHMPNQPTAADVLLDVGEDCVILHAKSGKYKLDIDLPFDVDNDSAGSQFNRKTKILTVTMSVLPNT